MNCKCTAVYGFLAGMILCLSACAQPTKESVDPSDLIPVSSESQKESESGDALSFDRVYAAGEKLGTDEENRVVAFLKGTEGEDLPWLFLGQIYDDPSEIDLGRLFYNGTEKTITGEERSAAAQAIQQPELENWEIQKRTVESMKTLFKRYTGTEPTEKQLEGACTGIYLPQYDAYYSFSTDTESAHVELRRICRLSGEAASGLGLSVTEKEIVAVEWALEERFRTGTSVDTGMILLAPSAGTWKILANMKLSESK